MIPEFHKTINFKDKVYIEQYGNFIKAWKYKNENNKWVFCIACYDTGNIGRHGNKLRNFKKFIYKNNDWVIDNTKKHNVLFNIAEIVNKEKPIVIVDNELSIDILNETNKDDFTFTTWPGEITDIEKTDFSILKNKSVYYFSSSYILSKTAIKFFQEKLDNIIIVSQIVERPGWNIADDFEDIKMEPELIRAWILNPSIALKKKDKWVEEENEINWPFQILGPGHGYYYFLHGEHGQIISVKQGCLTNQQLITLAPLEFWDLNFSYTTKKGGEVISWINAQDKLIRACNARPPFDFNSIRGRGIWQNKDGSLIIHTGEELIFCDKKINIKKYCPNGHAYERLSEKKLNIRKLEVNDFELMCVKDCISKLSINSKLEKMLLFGWCVLAMFGGALDWRPHIWLTGPAGSGKTAIIKMIILKILGDFAMYAEGGSTGAGIFQKLKKTNDSFPVVHDEIDKNDKSSIRSEIEIIRSCSASGGHMYKGTADQMGKEYYFKNMFCLSSVNVFLTDTSDRSRFSIINISKNENLDWKKFRTEIIKTFSFDMCEKIRSKFFYNWPVAEKTIRNFKDTIGVYCGDQRTGDQIGTLLAGYYLLFEMKIFGHEEIDAICEKHLKNHIDDNQFMSDEIELLNKILTSRIVYRGEGIEDTTLLYLLKRAVGDNDGTPDIKCQKELFKYGIRYEQNNNCLYIACSHQWLKTLLKETSWMSNYADILKRLSFAQKQTKVIRFGNHYQGRAVALRADCVYDMDYMKGE